MEKEYQFYAYVPLKGCKLLECYLSIPDRHVDLVNMELVYEWTDLLHPRSGAIENEIRVCDIEEVKIEIHCWMFIPCYPTRVQITQRKRFSSEKWKRRDGE